MSEISTLEQKIAKLLTEDKADQKRIDVQENNSEYGKQILQKAKSADKDRAIGPTEDLSQSINKAKKSFIEFIEGLLKSSWVKNWFRIFFYFVLFCLVWFVVVSLYDLLYSTTPNKFFIDIWKSSIEFLKLVFAVIGVLFVAIKLIINGKF
ncbi:hypothetical protein [Campylobacter concisus]|jgi:hypothetical protein|uniref:hypothetical protein n=1 Tax=Campylobacter concisus TaxID=199 RepID=UPI000CD81094|nr:hypothetical protein [Campylobacter concisus]